MRILVSGTSGLIGSAIVRALRARGDEVVALVRSRDRDGVLWNPSTNEVGDVSGFDAIVHLAGEGVADGRWSAERKRRIRDSRIDGTRLLVQAVTRAEPRPATFVCASAVGYYGPEVDEPASESAPPSDDFLSDVVQGWEAASEPLVDLGVRVARLRIGVVLSAEGGMLARLRLPFSFGVGGVVGDGSQWMSWITRTDLVRAFLHALDEPGMAGVYNAVAPNPVTNREFTKALGRALSRPTVLPLPKFVARAIFGREFADLLLLASTRVVPKRLTESGFAFHHPEIDSALEHALAPSDPER